MPKNSAIKSILVIGSGPINIGQACEFDYSGTQALKALKEEGYRVILVNSNPATIMTDPELSDATYIEPLTTAYLKAIIEKEKPDALIATLGGQTSLNCALALHREGVLAQLQVKLIGASIEAITLAEDRTLFHQKMREIGLDVPASRTAHQVDEAIQIMNELGLPLIVRSSFTLGGKGAFIVHNADDAIQVFKQVFSDVNTKEITLDEALIGWKEFELEVVRDQKDNCIVVCGVENVDPLGIHTGDSITVAPIQTLSDKEYQTMRDAAFKVLRAVGVDTGGSNVQFAIHPQTGRMVVIEMNPRVSRSSALVSKATGYPIAKIAAKLAVGFTLDELANDITLGALPAAFEPSIDYVVVKIPRFHDEKFNAQSLSRGPEMRSVGEVMAIGSTFAESLQLAMCSLETGVSGFDPLDTLDVSELKSLLSRHTSVHLWAIAESYRRGILEDEIQSLTQIDPWFLLQIKQLVFMEQTLQGKNLQALNHGDLLVLKKNGFSDQRIAQLTGSDESHVRQLRHTLKIHPVYKCVDSCAGEFEASTAYLYSTYQTYCETTVSSKPKILIVGSGPNRIGQGIEFDYVCVKAIQAFSGAGFETIMLNCNPETVSTDFDVASKLYFVPLTFEKVLDIIEKEKPSAVALQFGGQTPLNLMKRLEDAGVPLMGLNSNIVQMTEDREHFRTLVNALGLKQPKNITLNPKDNWEDQIESLQFPLIIRPSFVLGGSGMEVIADKKTFKTKLTALFKTTGHPVLVEEFLDGAIEVDVDAVSDGEDVFIPTVLEHIEPAGIHSGDSACITPPYRLSPAITGLIHRQTRQLAKKLALKGLMNIQFAVKDAVVYLIEVNPRASRTTPFICKATGISLIDIAVLCMLGTSLRQQRCLSPVSLPFYCVKEAVLPFHKFATSRPFLSPEMKSTGEVMGIGATPYEAFLKAQIGAGNLMPHQDVITVFVSGFDMRNELMQWLIAPPFKVVNTLDASNPPSMILSVNGCVEHLSFALQYHIPYASTFEAATMLVKSVLEAGHQDINVHALQVHYQHLKHPVKTRHCLTGCELTANEVHVLLDMALAMKHNPEHYQQAMAKKSLAMIFEKPSFRTRLSFAMAIQSMGGIAIESVSNTRKQEEPTDQVRVLNGYADFIMVRTHDEQILQDMAVYATSPIINGLSALHHPCQVFADLLSLQETFSTLDGLTLAYIGDGNNILHSLMLLAPRLGVSVHYCCPPHNQPNQNIVEKALINHGDLIRSFTTPEAAVHQAHAVYTDVWTSMGFEVQSGNKAFNGFQVNEALMSQARPEAVFMHCMPMERGNEVSLTLPDSPASIIFTQSENRMHVQKALMWLLLQ
jgi:carbamoyl-phosphate synthase large subunit